MAMAVSLGLAVGSAHAATTTCVINLGAPGSGTTFGSSSPVLEVGMGVLPAGSFLRSVSLNYRLDGGNPYLGDLAPLFADSNGDNGVLMIAGTPNDYGYPKGAVTSVSWDSGGDYSVGVTGSVTLTAADGIPAIDLHDYAMWLQTGWLGTWSGSVTLEYDVPSLSIGLNAPADGEGYQTGTSIAATATVIEPSPATGPYTVKFYTKLLPAGPLVEWLPSHAGLLYTAALGVLAAGDYQVYATVTDSATPTAGTATSATRVFHVAAAVTTTTTLASTGNPSSYGQNVTFTATVSPTPTGGTVQFYDGGSPLGSPAAVDPGTGQATLSTTTLGAGSHPITANFSGHWLYLASVASALSQGVDKAPLTVKALNTLRAPNTANPDPLPYQITGYQNGESFTTSGVTGAPLLTTAAMLSSPAGNYDISCALGSLAASNYSFTLVGGTLTVAVVPNTFSVNFYSYGGLSTPDQQANVLVAPGMPAGMDGWYTSGWLNFEVPWAPSSPLPAVTLTSNQGSSATFTFKDCRNGWTYNGVRTTLLGDGNGNMMDGHVNSTFDPGDGSNLFDMEVTSIPFAVYDVIFYMGANLAQYGDGTGVIVFNGGAQRAFTVEPGAFDGTFTEMIDATTPGNYIVFKGVTGASFTTQTWGTGPNGFNHVGPFGFQIKEATVATGYGTWASNYAGGANAPADADYNHDGVQNGVAYFMGMNGLATNPGVVAGKVTWPHVGVVASFEVQVSNDLSTWVPAASGDVDTSDPSKVVFTLPTGASKKFCRLVVTP